ncbi:hypothetical protein SDC9_86433 [bioreactor metagenome]|uniref:Uncharacterized protein n=1 Tax=bioreactor metagenome TaxID=1076179 RepID=A0A644ZHK8_9ZZZZ|nr:Gfo/Idh/MocA family oxidoreductase [Candidatus Pelethousia sp.]
MKICFVGLGSIGTRHLKNLSTLLMRKNIAFSIDALRSNDRPLQEDVALLLHRQYADITDMPCDYDIAFICSPTASHYADVVRMVDHTQNMFIEKPVFDRFFDFKKLGLREDGMYYVACPLRYNAVLQYLKGFIEREHIYAVRAICSTYLPDWRPSVDYRTVYSAHQNMGGGVSIDLIHEWDYICWLFGFPQKVQYSCGQFSKLDLDSDDLAVYIGQYPDKLISLHLDYFGRSERREIELYTEDETVVGDIRNGQVRFLRKGQSVGLAEARDEYQSRELQHFLNIIDGKIKNDSDVKHALNVLSIARGEWNE